LFCFSHPILFERVWFVWNFFFPPYSFCLRHFFWCGILFFTLFFLVGHFVKCKILFLIHILCFRLNHLVWCEIFFLFHDLFIGVRYFYGCDILLSFSYPIFFQETLGNLGHTCVIKMEYNIVISKRKIWREFQTFKHRRLWQCHSTSTLLELIPQNFKIYKRTLCRCQSHLPLKVLWIKFFTNFCSWIFIFY